MTVDRGRWRGPVNELPQRLMAGTISAVELDRAALEGLRQMILADGARKLGVGDLCDDEPLFEGDPADDGDAAW